MAEDMPGHLETSPLASTVEPVVQPEASGGLAAFFGDQGEIAEELDVLLPESKLQLGHVANCISQGATDLKQIVDAGAAANTGAAANLIVNIRAIRNGEIPQDAPSRARLALGFTRSFLKQHGSRLFKPRTEPSERGCRAVARCLGRPRSASA